MGRRYNTCRIPLSLLKFLGLYSEVKSNRVKAIAVLHSSISLFISCMIAIQFPFIKGDIFDFISNAQGLAAFSQISGKLIVTAFQQEQLIKILHSMKIFWKPNGCSSKFVAKLDWLAAVNISIQRLFIYCVIVSTFIVIIYGLLSKSLPFGVWSIETIPRLRTLTWISELIELSCAAVSTVGFDTLFLSLCTEAIVQIRILQYHMKSLNLRHYTNKDYYRAIKSYVRRHIFLLSFLQSLQDYYSVALLIEYLTICPLICAGMYAVIEGKTMAIIVQHGAMGGCLLIQLAFYCFAADFVCTEALEICDAIYNSDWYTKYNPDVLVPVTLVMQKSQKSVVFKAGGLVEINIRTLLVVLRTAWSICTVMRALKSSN